MFSVFDSLTVASDGVGGAQGQLATSNLILDPVPDVTGDRWCRPELGTSSPIAAGSTTLRAGIKPQSSRPDAFATGGSRFRVVSGQRSVMSVVERTRYPALREYPPPGGGKPNREFPSFGLDATKNPSRVPTRLQVPIWRSIRGPGRAGSEWEGRRHAGREGPEETGDWSFLRPPPSALRRSAVVVDPAVPSRFHSAARPVPAIHAPGLASLTDILLAAGFCGYGAGILSKRNSPAGRLRSTRKSRFLADHHAMRGHREH